LICHRRDQLDVKGTNSQCSCRRGTDECKRFDLDFAERLTVADALPEFGRTLFQFGVGQAEKLVGAPIDFFTTTLIGGNAHINRTTTDPFQRRKDICEERTTTAIL